MATNFIARTEKMTFRFKYIEVDEMSSLQKKLFEELLPAIMKHMISGDGIKFKYEFLIDYLGGIEHTFEVIEKLLDSGIAIEAESREINYAKCIIQNIFAKIERIEKKFEEGK